MLTADGAILSRINAVSPASDGGAWVSAVRGLFRLPGGDTNILVRVHDTVLDAAESPRVMSALQRGDGSLWVAAHKGALSCA